MARLCLNNPYWKQHLALAGISLGAWVAIIVLIEPTFVANVVWKESYLPFFAFLWLGCFWLFTGLSGRWKRSLLWASSVVGWAILRSKQLDGPITVMLLIAFNLVWAYYWKISKV